MQREDEADLSQGDLADIADAILERAGEDFDALAGELDMLDPAVRRQLLVSDFLNAFQVYYYFYRKVPGELEQERLLLQPASALCHGVLLAEMDLFVVIFRVEEGRPVISVGDGESILANFREKDAYEKALRFIDESG
ncbi:MAG: hypothetical protein QHH04_00190 [Methanolinea sp.]|jgi:hypothetical protein|nr:hypothetical protein [Methanolinea sp.]